MVGRPTVCHCKQRPRTMEPARSADATRHISAGRQKYPSIIAVPSRHEEVCQLRLPGAGAADDAGAAAAVAASTAR